MFSKKANKAELIELAKAVNLKIQEMKMEMSVLKHIKAALLKNSDNIQSLKKEIENLKNKSEAKSAFRNKAIKDDGLPDNAVGEVLEDSSGIHKRRFPQTGKARGVNR